MLCGVCFWYALCQSRFVLCMYVYIHIYTPRNIQWLRERGGEKEIQTQNIRSTHTRTRTRKCMCVYACVHMLIRCKHHCCCCRAAVIVVVALVLFCLIQQRIQEKKGKEKQIQLLTHTLLQLLKNAATALWFSYSLPSRRTHQHNKHTYTKCMHTYTSHTQ